MSTKKWYVELLNRNILYEQSAENDQILQTVKCESLHPFADWQLNWNYINLQGLSSEQSTFLFRLLHGLLPVGTRLFRMRFNATSHCTKCINSPEEDLAHALLRCDFNGDLNTWILLISRRVVPGIRVEDILTLNLGIRNLGEAFPLVWLLSILLEAVWKARSSRNAVLKTRVRADLEAKINLLRKTRFGDYATKITETLLAS